MAKKIIALFVEGPTEKEFYKAVVKTIHSQLDCAFDCEIQYIDMKGIGNYKRAALRKYNDLQNKNSGAYIYPFLCIDSDVFEFNKKPPFNKKEVIAELKKAGAKSPKFIQAKQSIEDWFLYDIKGVFSYLKLGKNCKVPKGNGQKVLKELFRKANKLYVKGSKTEGFIDKLNIGLIMSKCCKELMPLCKQLKPDCRLLCSKKSEIWKQEKSK